MDSRRVVVLCFAFSFLCFLSFWSSLSLSLSPLVFVSPSSFPSRLFYPRSRTYLVGVLMFAHPSIHSILPFALSLSLSLSFLESFYCIPLSHPSSFTSPPSRKNERGRRDGLSAPAFLVSHNRENKESWVSLRKRKRIEGGGGGGEGKAKEDPTRPFFCLRREKKKRFLVVEMKARLGVGWGRGRTAWILSVLLSCM